MFARVKPLGWGYLEVLTSGQVTAIDANASAAMDGLAEVQSGLAATNAAIAGLGSTATGGLTELRNGLAATNAALQSGLAATNAAVAGLQSTFAAFKRRELVAAEQAIVPEVANVITQSLVVCTTPIELMAEKGDWFLVDADVSAGPLDSQSGGGIVGLGSHPEFDPDWSTTLAQTLTYLPPDPGVPNQPSSLMGLFTIPQADPWPSNMFFALVAHSSSATPALGLRVYAGSRIRVQQFRNR